RSQVQILSPQPNQKAPRPSGPGLSSSQTNRARRRLDRGEAAVKHRVEAFALQTGIQLHALDHRADDLDRLGAILAVEDRLQLLDLAAVEIVQGRMRQDRHVSFGRVVVVDAEAFALGLQVLQPRLHRRIIEAVLYRPHQA
ncbi:MAG: hypothetical protein JWL93_468, partial [Hyphomicrobiales bacterium]|nr:hypothetical protein [Hyphomicrobiales bacterium]